ncbi:MAG: hypothetical protein NTW87_12605 [Planctomycetota bacterium]|nr:hypothetical protein [Planctomycetota bacterium]
MPAPEPRRFQFHLATLLVTVIMAGALLGLHMRPFTFHARGPEVIVEATRYGFPFAFYDCHAVTPARTLDGPPSSAGTTLNVLAALFNFAIVVWPVAYLVERHARRKPQDPETRRWSAPDSLAVAFALLVAVMILIADLGPARATSMAYGYSRLDGRRTFHSWHRVVERGWPCPAYRLFTATYDPPTLTIWDEHYACKTAPSDAGALSSRDLEPALLAAAQVRYTAPEIVYNLVGSFFIVLAAFFVSRALARKLLSSILRRPT